MGHRASGIRFWIWDFGLEIIFFPLPSSFFLLPSSFF
jgi:hypothetical protein